MISINYTDKLLVHVIYCCSLKSMVVSFFGLARLKEKETIASLLSKRMIPPMKFTAPLKVDFLIEEAGTIAVFCACNVTALVTAGMAKPAGKGWAAEGFGDGLAGGPTKYQLALLRTAHSGAAAFSQQQPPPT